LVDEVHEILHVGCVTCGNMRIEALMEQGGVGLLLDNRNLMTVVMVMEDLEGNVDQHVGSTSIKGHTRSNPQLLAQGETQQGEVRGETHEKK
jgi:hypothetical protein